MGDHKRDGDRIGLLGDDEVGASGGPVGENPFGEAVKEVELQEIHTIQGDVVDMARRLWESETMTDEDAEELERQSNLLKYKLAMASAAVQEWGMQQALEKIQDHENRRKWRDTDSSKDDVQKVAMKMAPIAFGFMLLVGLASQVHFDDSRLLPGKVHALSSTHCLVYPLASASHMVEAKIQIPSSGMPGSGGGHHRRSGRSSRADVMNYVRALYGKSARTSKLSAYLLGTTPGTPSPPAAGHGPTTPGTPARPGTPPTSGHGTPASPPSPPAHGTPATPSHGPAPSPPAAGGGHVSSEPEHEGPVTLIQAYIFEMRDSEWQHKGLSFDNLTASALDAPNKLTQWEVMDDEEQAAMLEFDVPEDPSNFVFVLATTSEAPLGVVMSFHSLGFTGPYQVVIAGFILVFVFGLIVTEVMHRCMAAMIGAAITLTVLAVQHRVPNLAKTVGWMDHGTLALLWGMMIIVGVTTRTGVFEWTGVVACKMSGGSKKKLLLLLCLVTGILSAFLDNVTTILLISPVTIKLCALVNQNPVPYLISEAIFSNLGGTATMIGDPPNIIIGNMLSKHIGFVDFLLNLCPGVIVSCPAVFYFLIYFWRTDFEGQLKADIPKLQKLYPITDPQLLVKCGAVLACVISSFFLHPLTHFDPAWVAILGAIWLLVAFDMHHCHEALHGVEWDTLLFFAALFVIVEGLGELGLLRFVAETLGGMIAEASIGSRQYFAIGLILWSSAFFSAFVDNIPFTATMVPILIQLAEDVPGIAIEPLAWALAFGACFGGNGTLIGASANIVMAGKAAAEGHHISFVEFFKVGMPAMIISMVTATIYMMALNAFVYQSIVDAAGAAP